MSQDVWRVTMRYVLKGRHVLSLCTHARGPGGTSDLLQVNLLQVLCARATGRRVGSAAFGRRTALNPPVRLHDIVSPSLGRLLAAGRRRRCWRRSVDVLVDHGVVLRVDDDAVVMVMMEVVVPHGGRGYGGADGRQRLVRGRSVLVLAAGRGRHHHGRNGRRVPAAAGLVRQHPVTLVRAGATRTGTVRPRARLVVRVEHVRVDVFLDRVCVGRHHVVRVVMVVVLRVTATVDQRL